MSTTFDITRSVDRLSEVEHLAIPVIFHLTVKKIENKATGHRVEIGVPDKRVAVDGLSRCPGLVNHFV